MEEWKKRNNKNQKDRQGQHFSIPFEEIKRNDFELNFNLYKEFVYEHQEYEKPSSIYKKIEVIEKEIPQWLVVAVIVLFIALTIWSFIWAGRQVHVSDDYLLCHANPMEFCNKTGYVSNVIPNESNPLGDLIDCERHQKAFCEGNSSV